MCMNTLSSKSILLYGPIYYQNPGTFSGRLVSRNEKTSSTLTAGRLEVFFSGKWGAVCSDGFTSTDASVFCSVTTGSTTVLRYGPVGSDGLE